jgi:hypothetical protein
LQIFCVKSETTDGSPVGLHLNGGIVMPGMINSWAEFQAFMDQCCAKVGAEPDFAPHGRWWQEMTFETFISNGTVEGERIVDPGNPDNSRVVQALEGRPPFGPGETFRQMPPGTPFEVGDIAEIRDWIGRGCPNPSPHAA